MWNCVCSAATLNTDELRSSSLSLCRRPVINAFVFVSSELSHQHFPKHYHVLRFQTPDSESVDKFNLWVKRQRDTHGDVDVWHAPGQVGDVRVKKHISGRSSGLDFKVFVDCLQVSSFTVCACTVRVDGDLTLFPTLTWCFRSQLSCSENEKAFEFVKQTRI